MPDDVYKDVSTNWYTGLSGAGENARARSQTAWTIASAIAGALLAAGLAKNFAQSVHWVLALGIAAVVAWLVTAAVFMWAVTTPLPDPPGEVKEDTVEKARLTFVQIGRAHV